MTKDFIKDYIKICQKHNMHLECVDPYCELEVKMGEEGYQEILELIKLSQPYVNEMYGKYTNEYCWSHTEEIEKEKQERFKKWLLDNGYIE